jgi:hypothetical protein
MIDHRSSRGGAVTGVLLAALFSAPPLRAQAPAGYSESITSSITSRTASAELVRGLTREIRYARSMRGDTLVMQATQVRLEEQGEGGVLRHPTEGVTGGRWKLLPGARGGWQVVDRPFVPPALLEVNDLASAMDDFFPPLAPPLQRDGRIRDGAGRSWHRLSDSAGVRRYEWEVSRTRDTTTYARDTVPVQVEEEVQEIASLRLDARGEPLGWTRTLTTEVYTRGGGRGVRATVRQVIVVRALP